MTVPEIRPAVPADIDDLVALMTELRRAMAALNPAATVASPEEMRRVAANYLSSPYQLALITTTAGQAVGFIRANLRDDSGFLPLPGREIPWREALRLRLRAWRSGGKRTNRALYIADLYVRPDHRRGGLGRALVEAVEDRLAAANPDYGYLMALFHNQAGRAFWERVGYKPDSVTMTKRIPRPPEMPGGA